MPDSIHLTVATVVHMDGLYLMVREHDNGHEVINQPAGHVEPGETLQQAALRETLEESGWQINLSHFLGISHYTAPANGKTYYRVSFAAEPVSRQAGATLDPDIIAAEWQTLDQLRRCNNLRSPMVLADVEKFASGTIYPLSLIQTFPGPDLNG
jgi:ADP-ribose pyrophosphatase YjhB (NUDIX family)